VNSLTNPAFYLNNDPTDFGYSTTPYNTEFDGFTTGLTAAIQVIPGEKYKFKLAITDNSDGIYDLAVFIPIKSFASLTLVPVTDSFLVSSDSPTSLDVLDNDLALEGEQPFVKYFDPLSNNGGTVALDENQTPEDPFDDNLLYTPPSGFSGLDNFNYTIADSSGNTVTGTVYIQVDNATPPPPPPSVYYLTTATTWTDAQAQAQSMGGNLVTINDATENQFLVNTFGGEWFWIGYTDQAEEGLWQWISGESSSYTNWWIGEPNNAYGDEDYAVTNWGHLGIWNDLPNWYYNPKGIVEVVGGTSTLSVGDVSVAENGSHEVLVPVTLNGIGNLDQTFTVDYSLTPGTATEDQDYTTIAGTLTFNPGDNIEYIVVPLQDDEVIEGNETFFVNLSNVTGGAVLDQSTATVTISENEKYTFTYFYGNGDSYSGYGFAPSGTYSVGQLP
ncbi:MAG: Calx-beta domain-containing protein, partial [Snowella sp.]